MILIYRAAHRCEGDQKSIVTPPTPCDHVLLAYHLHEMPDILYQPLLPLQKNVVKLLLYLILPREEGNTGFIIRCFNLCIIQPRRPRALLHLTNTAGAPLVGARVTRSRNGYHQILYDHDPQPYRLLGQPDIPGQPDFDHSGTLWLLNLVV